MKLGMVGLGRMGANMTERLLVGGHEVIGFDFNEASRRRMAEKGAGEAASLEKLAGELEMPRTIWLMIPAGEPVEETLQILVPILDPGDVIIDGGNSWYRDTVRRDGKLREHGIHLVDSGTSEWIEIRYSLCRCWQGLFFVSIVHSDEQEGYYFFAYESKKITWHWREKRQSVRT